MAKGRRPVAAKGTAISANRRARISAKVAAYIAKYIGKDMGGARFNKKKYYTSRGINAGSGRVPN
jgi:hypothetical protein